MKNENIKIIRAKHMGFCFGVSGAIETCYNVLKSSENTGKRIFILGMLVHNEFVVEKLKAEGFLIVEEHEILDQIDDLREDDIVIIRAHGTSKKIYEILKKKNVKIYDATCTFVAHIRKTLIEMEKQGYEILFVGDKEHPEVKGIISFGKSIKVFKDLEEIQNAQIDREKKYCLLTQTTLNKKILEKIKSFLENHYSNVKISDKVCGATQVRQQAVEELAKEVDMLLVIGGKNSSNTKKLYDISKMINEKTYLVQDESEVQDEWFQNCEKIGITAGASTPEEIVINIENKIRGIINV